MRAVWMRARNELRSNWRAMVALCLLAGIPGGFGIAAGIGASRTDTVSDRTVAATNPPDIYYFAAFQDTKLAFEDIAALPVVSSAYLVRAFPAMAPTPEDLEVSAPHATDLPHAWTKLLAGRFPDPARTDEALITFRAADRFHWHVGTVVRLALASPATDFSSDAPPTPGPVVDVHVVGVGATPGDLVAIAGPGMTLTSAFERTYAPRAATLDLQVFKLRRGPADFAAFEKGVRKISGGRGVIYSEAESDVLQVKRSFHLQAVALWVTCAFLAAVSFLIFGQALARQAMLQSNEYPALRALGMTRRDLTTLGIVRACLISFAAAALAVALGIALSLATPFGLARVIEPQPGLWMPAAIVGLGAAALIAAVVLFSIIPSLRAALLARREPSAAVRPTLAARALSFITSRPSPAVGARFALEQGRGSSSVPVRSSMVASIAGLVVLLAALSVGVSVKHFVATPRLYGWTWDVAYDSGHAVAFTPGSKALRDLANDPSISDLSVGGFGGATFRLSGIGLDGAAMDPVKGHLEPDVLEGRSPTGADEVVVGRKSLQQAHAHIGSTVTVGVVGFRGTAAMRVVGVAVMPFDDDTSTIGEGLWMTAEGMRHIVPNLPPADSALIRFAPGVSHAAALAKLKHRFEGDFSLAETPGGVKDYQRISQIPLILAGLLAALAAGTLAHMLVSSIRRRRRDLAILKTLGFERRQLRSAVVWQATVFTSIVLLVAVPLGVVAGRWTWNVIAGYGGFDPSPAVSPGEFALVAAGTLFVAIALSLLPARAAARTPAAVVLRTE